MRQDHLNVSRGIHHYKIFQYLIMWWSLAQQRTILCAVNRMYSVTTACNHPIQLSSDSGYVSTLATYRSGLGSYACPWLISAPQGQHVLVTIYDFSAADGHAAVVDRLQKSPEKKNIENCPAIVLFQVNYKFHSYFCKIRKLIWEDPKIFFTLFHWSRLNEQFHAYINFVKLAN